MSNVPPIDLLQRQIKRAEQELVFAKETGAAQDDFAVLFTGNWHDSIPRNLILNNTLSPVDKVCWQAIRLTINSPQQPGTAPTRDELAVMVNCSAPTITTARQMLRLCRYMTFCSVVRHKGKFLGEVYLLHEEPLSIEDTLALDSTYLEFCVALAKSGNKSSRLRKEAGQVLRDIDHEGLRQTPPTKSQALGERIAQGLENYGLEEHLDPEGFNQRKNFAPDGFLDNAIKKSSNSAKTVDFNQSKNFAPDQKMTNSNQSKNFALVSEGVFCSSFWSRSINNKVINTRTHARAISEATPVDMDEWVENLPDKQDYTRDCMPSYDDDMQPKQASKPEWMLNDFEIDQLGAPNEVALPPPPLAKQSNIEQPLRSKSALPVNRSPSVGSRRTYESINPESNYDSGGFQATLNRYLPEISDPVLARYSSVGFFGIQPQIPVIARAISGLSPLERRDVLLQYMGRKASCIHGWHDEDVTNPIGYIKSLCKRITDGVFFPDSFCGELIRSLHEQTPPVFCDTQEIRAKKQEIENYGEEFERWKECNH